MAKKENKKVSPAALDDDMLDGVVGGSAREANLGARIECSECSRSFREADVVYNGTLYMCKTCYRKMMETIDGSRKIISGWENAHDENVTTESTDNTEDGGIFKLV